MNQVDYDIHGVVGVRLLNATPSDVAAVGRLFGPIARGLIRPPDIVIRYVPRLPARTLQHIQIDRTRFSSAGDCVLGNASGSQASLALDHVGQRCEIVCEHGIGEVPLLVPIVHLSALSKGVVAVHGSAVVHRGAGLLMAAWAHGGKTTGMLAFMAENAEFIGDEWILISRDGRRMAGLPQPVAVHAWQLRQWPALKNRLPPMSRFASLAAGGLDRLDATNGRTGRRRRSRGVARLIAAARNRLELSIDPQSLGFAGRRGFFGPLDAVCVMVRHDAPDVRVESVLPLKAIRHIAASTEQELAPLTAAYRAFRCAFPDRTNDWLERASEVRTTLLSRALRDKQPFVVYHPERGSLRALFEAMAGVCGAGVEQAAAAVRPLQTAASGS